MTTGQVAKQLGVSKGCIIKWHKRGWIAARVTLGGQRIYSQEEVARIERLMREKLVTEK